MYCATISHIFNWKQVTFLELYSVVHYTATIYGWEGGRECIVYQLLVSVYKEGGNERLIGVDMVFVYREGEWNDFQNCYSVLL